jgi:hypothetical protein
MAGEVRALMIAREALKRGVPRQAFGRTTDAHFLWRINAAAQQLKRLLDTQERGARTTRTIEDLNHIEYRIAKMTTDAQLVLIEQALPEEKTVCDG